MAVIQFACSQCGATVQTAALLAGQNVLCPGCGAILVVPREPTPAAVLTTPPPTPPVLAPSPLLAPVPLPAAAAIPPESPPAGMRPVPIAAPPLATATAAPFAEAGSAPQPGIRRLTPAEKEGRRARRNVLLCVFGIATLIVTLAALLKFVRR